MEEDGLRFDEILNKIIMVIDVENYIENEVCLKIIYKYRVF